MANSKYVYQVLTQDEQDEIMVSFIHGQERDLYCHMLSQERYREMLRTLPEGDWRKHIVKMEKVPASWGKDASTSARIFANHTMLGA